jgi:hypothetical protein
MTSIAGLLLFVLAGSLLAADLLASRSRRETRADDGAPTPYRDGPDSGSPSPSLADRRWRILRVIWGVLAIVAVIALVALLVFFLRLAPLLSPG